MGKPSPFPGCLDRKRMVPVEPSLLAAIYKHHFKLLLDVWIWCAAERTFIWNLPPPTIQKHFEYHLKISKETIELKKTYKSTHSIGKCFFLSMASIRTEVRVSDNQQHILKANRSSYGFLISPLLVPFSCLSPSG